MAHKRNVGLHTDASEARKNILLALMTSTGGMSKSGMGFVAYPNYSFKAPQGAAFAVAKIARKLEDDGLIKTNYRYHGDEYCGYGIHLTSKGRDEAAKLVE